MQYHLKDPPSFYKVKQMLPALIDFAEFVLDFCSFAFMAGLSQSLPHLFQLILVLFGHWDLFLIVLITKRLHVCSAEYSVDCISHVHLNKSDIFCSLKNLESKLNNEIYTLSAGVQWDDYLSISWFHKKQICDCVLISPSWVSQSSPQCWCHRSVRPCSPFAWATHTALCSSHWTRPTRSASRSLAACAGTATGMTDND